MQQDLTAFCPEIVLVAGVLAAFVADLFLSRKPIKRVVVAAIAFVTVCGAGICLFCPASSSGLLFGGMVHADAFSVYFKALFAVAVCAAVVFSYFSDEVERDRDGEYYAILLAMTLAMFLLSSATNALMIFLSLEFLSVASYVLVAFRRRDKRSTEAALKYVVYGALASGLMLFGFSYLYGLVGSLDIVEIGRGLEQIFAGGATTSAKLIGSVSVMMVFAGFAYKIAAVPFHMWCPDVYEGAPTPVAAILSVGPKAAGFAVLIRFLISALPAGTIPWPAIIGIISVATMTLGNIAAIHQNNIKRLLAYSSIAHAGYMLMAVSAGSPDGTSAVMFYAAVYMLMNLGAFVVVMSVRASAGGSEEISTYDGLSKTQPLLAVLMTIFLFSLVGIPPFGGFIGKFYLFAALIKKAGYWYYVIALAGVVNSAVSLYYYARIIKAMFLKEPVSGNNIMKRAPAAFAAIAVILAVPVLVLGVYWSPLYLFAERSTDIFK
ncbi:MAG: hypothetical protein A2583_06220 [Bdellovibrionales bacterium RIFOXYD1_FULL_53_11]|nr:MAG: hypothetical protein A2583_06220 [Bdellovibrionales bacterium RIFOXYD1_FULL_53_11]